MARHHRFSDGIRKKLVSGVSKRRVVMFECASAVVSPHRRDGAGKGPKGSRPHGDPGWRSCLCPQSNLWVGIRKLSVRCWEHGYRVEVYVPAWDRKAASGRASGLPVQAGSRCGSARTSSAESCGSKVRARRVSKPECYRCEDRIMLSILRDSGFTSPWGMRILPNGSAYGGMGLPMPEREFRGRCYRPHSAEMLLWFLRQQERCQSLGCSLRITASNTRRTGKRSPPSSGNRQD
jgi:hypothetical protein